MVPAKMNTAQASLDHLGVGVIEFLKNLLPVRCAPRLVSLICIFRRSNWNLDVSLADLVLATFVSDTPQRSGASRGMWIPQRRSRHRIQAP